jgi:hypothetical protein
MLSEPLGPASSTWNDYPERLEESGQVLAARTRGNGYRAVERFTHRHDRQVVEQVVPTLGNVALFALRPAEHWPVLETIEGLQTASLIPIARLLHRSTAAPAKALS